MMSGTIHPQSNTIITIAERDKDGKSYPCTQIGHEKNFKSTLWRSQCVFLEARSPQKH